jgi:branched-chain amino acid transport system ATP-binding protein
VSLLTLQVDKMAVERNGREVLHGVDLMVAPGEIVALLGANGAGKSSLIMAIAGALTPKSGSVRLGSLRLSGLPAHMVRRQGVAVVSEGHPVLNGLSVQDNLRAAGLMLSRSEAEHGVAAALDVFPELKERLEVAAQYLSGGQKQLVNIAQALIARPKYLLIDELSFGLAPAVLVRLGDVIRGVAAGGVGVLLVEQFTTLALSLASRAYVIERGQIVFNGPSRDLEARPEILHGAYLATAKPLSSSQGDI